MVLFRALGWLLLVLSVAAAVQNGLTWWSEGAFRLLTLADMWAHFDYGSFAAVQGFVVERVSPRGGTTVLQPILRLPAVPVFFILGLVLLWIGQPGGARGEGGLGSAVFVGSRRPRRKRGRGGLS